MKSFTVITPTGDRPKPFELCKKFMQRQTILPSQWIVIDDGRNPLVGLDGFIPNITYIRREPNKVKDPRHTLGIQMIKAFEHLWNDIVIIMEDDDWYRKDYFENIIKVFESNSSIMLVGQGNTIYYHIPRQKYYIHNNTQHASWCMTAFRTNLLSSIEKICKQCVRSNYPYIDLRIWKQIHTNKHINLEESRVCIGIKGLPGRMGTVSGHREIDGFQQDVNFDFLRKHIGEDTKLYEEFVEKNGNGIDNNISQ